MIEPPADAVDPAGHDPDDASLAGRGLGAFGLAVTPNPTACCRCAAWGAGATPGRAQQCGLVLDDDRPPIRWGLLGDEPLTTLAPRSRCGGAVFGVGGRGAISDEPRRRLAHGRAEPANILAVGSLVALLGPWLTNQ